MEKRRVYITPIIQSLEFLVEQSVLASSDVNAAGGRWYGSIYVEAGFSGSLYSGFGWGNMIAGFSS